MHGRILEAIRALERQMTSKPPQPKDDDIASRIMAAMVKMPPKKHEEMKLGKKRKRDHGREASVARPPEG